MELNSLAGNRPPHVMRFYRCSHDRNKILMKYKIHFSSVKWYPDDDGIQVLTSQPSGEPELLQYKGKDIKKYLSQLKGINEAMQKLSEYPPGAKLHAPKEVITSRCSP